LRALLAVLNHAATERTTIAERSVAAYLGASCHSPLASFAVIEEDRINLTALVGSTDGRTLLRQQVSGPAVDAETLGSLIGSKLLELGAEKLLHEAPA
jgi:hydroxymethylbilane synthase